VIIRLNARGKHTQAAGTRIGDGNVREVMREAASTAIRTHAECELCARIAVIAKTAYLQQRHD